MKSREHQNHAHHWRANHDETTDQFNQLSLLAMVTVLCCAGCAEQRFHQPPITQHESIAREPVVNLPPELNAPVPQPGLAGSPTRPASPVPELPIPAPLNVIRSVIAESAGTACVSKGRVTSRTEEEALNNAIANAHRRVIDHVLEQAGQKGTARGKELADLYNQAPVRGLQSKPIGCTDSPLKVNTGLRSRRRRSARSGSLSMPRPCR